MVAPLSRVLGVIIGVAIAGLTAAPSFGATAPYALPRFSSLGFSTSTTTFAAGSTITLNGTLAPGSMPFMQAEFDFKNGNTTRRFYVGQNGGPVTVTVGTDWPNGTYSLSSIWVNDSFGNGSTFYTPQGVLSHTDEPWLVPAPGGPNDFSQLSFTVSGGTARPSPVEITAISGPTTAAPGTPVTYAFTLSDTPVAHYATISFTLMGPNSFAVAPAVTTSGAGGTATITPATNWPNGTYVLSATIGTDQSTPNFSNHTEFYYNYGPNAAAFPTPAQFVLSGAGSSTGPVALVSIQTALSAVGRQSFTDATSPSGASVVLEFADPLGYSHVGYGTSLFVYPTWPNGHYTLQKVTVSLAGYTSAIYYRDGTADIGQPQRINHQVNFVAADFDVTTGYDAAVPVTITTQPVAQTVNVGQTMTLTVGVSGGTPPITYSWYKDNVLIPGATSTTLTIPNAQAYDTGSYSLTISNPYGVGGSVPVQVTVIPATPFILTGPKSTTLNVGRSLTLSATAVGAGSLAYQWNKDGSPIAGATATSLQISSTAVNDSGKYTVSVTNANGVMTSDAATVVISKGPWIAEQPQSQTVPIGGHVRLAAVSDGSAQSVQWKRNGVALPGWTSELEYINSAQLSDMGFYSCTLTNATGTTESQVAILSVTDGTAARPVNISTRAQVNSTEPLTAGFVLSAPKTVLIRAVGPTLSSYGVSAPLADPKLALIPLGASSPIATNDNWGTSANASDIATTGATLGAFSLPAGSKDSAILTHLSAGAYTAQVTSADGGTGVALVEVYDADQSSTPGQLINISARSNVGTGENDLVVGFVLGGTAPRQVLLRAIGPGLAPLGVPSPLSDPQLVVYPLGASYQVAQNDNWGGMPTLVSAMASVGAFSIDATSKDAAVIVRLPPGAYSAVVSGVGGATGEAIVEVYDLGP